MPIPTPLIATAASTFFKTALPRLMDPWTRKKTLEYLHADLLALCASTELANDLFNRVKDESFLAHIASLRTPQEIHREVEAVVHPQGATDPQQIEALILTRALLSALLQATSSGTHDSLHSSMTLDLYLQNALPSLGELLHTHRQRQKFPGLSAQVDLADLLRRAGQTNMGIAMFMDGLPQVIGQPQVTLELGGRNAELFQQWSEGGHGANLVLHDEDGVVSVSFGHPELDRLLLPQGLSAKQFEIAEVKQEFEARVRVSAPDEPDVFVNTTVAYAPRTKEIEIRFGADKCFIWFTLAPIKSGGHHINVKFEIESGLQVLGAEYRPVLRAMRLLGREDMQVVLTSGTEILRPDGTHMQLEKDELLFDGKVWGASERSDGPRVEKALPVLSKVHLMYQQIATFLEEEHGIDPKQVVVLEELSQDAVNVLTRIDSVIKPSGTPISVNVKFDVNQDVGDLLTSPERLKERGVSEVLTKMEVTGVLDLGIRVLKTVGKIQDLNILETVSAGNLVEIHASGLLEDQTLTVHPAGTFSTFFHERETTD